MELRHLRAFLAVAEEGSVHSASRRLFITQPALSRQLGQLERTLATKLFDRTPRGMTLTKEGSNLLAEARRLLASADAFIDGAREESGTVRGRLRIGRPEEGLGPIEPLVLAAYRVAHPNVDVTVADCSFDEMSAMQQSADGDYDALLWRSSHLPEGLRGAAVYQERLQAVVADSSDLAAAESIDLATLLRERFVNLGDFSDDHFGPFELAHHRNGAQAQRAARERTADDMFQSVADGQGIMCATPGSEPLLGGLPVTFVDIDSNPSISCGVVTREDDRRQHVHNFAQIAHDIGTSLFSLIQGTDAPEPIGTALQ